MRHWTGFHRCPRATAGAARSALRDPGQPLIRREPAATVGCLETSGIPAETLERMFRDTERRGEWEGRQRGGREAQLQALHCDAVVADSAR